MDNFYPFGFCIMFFVLLLRALFFGEKTSNNDEEINDYWSDG